MNSAVMESSPVPAERRISVPGIVIGLAVTLAFNVGVLVLLVLVTAQRPTPPTITTIRIARAAPPAPPVTPPPPAPVVAHAAPAPRVPLPPLPALPAAAIGDPDLALPPPLAPVAVTLPPLVPAWAMANAGYGELAAVDQQNTPAPPDSIAPVLIGTINLQSYYPLSARIHGITGSSTLTIAIDAAGAVTAAHVQESDPPDVFDEAAQKLALHLHFQPAQSGGRAVPASLLYHIYWTLAK